MIPWAKPNYWGNEINYLIEAANSLWISGGDYVNKLENKFSELFNRKTLTVSNGTSSLHLIYKSLDLKPGDEIIIPGFCFLAAANVALHLNLNPIFSDVDPFTWCLDPNKIEEKINHKTRAIVAVHTYGNVCEMNEINKLAKKYNLYVIEDCAESLFSKYDNKYTGTLSMASSFSFQATKIITTGEGGLVATDNDDLFEKMFLIRSHGLPIRGSYYHSEPGHNFRLTNLQSAIGYGQMEYMEKIIKEKKRVYNKYINNLSNIKSISFQKINNNVDPLIWATAINIDNNLCNLTRNDIIEKLKEKGVETRPGFTTPNLINYFNKSNINISDQLSNNVLSFPSYATLTNNEIDYISEKFIDIIS